MDCCRDSRKIKLVTFLGFCVPDRKRSPYHKILLTYYIISWFQYFLSSVINKGQQGIDHGMVRLWSLLGLKPFNDKQRKKLLTKRCFQWLSACQASRAYTFWSSMATLCMETVFAFNLVIKIAKSNKLRYSSTIIESPVVLILNVYP